MLLLVMGVGRFEYRRRVTVDDQAWTRVRAFSPAVIWLGEDVEMKQRSQL